MRYLILTPLFLKIYSCDFPFTYIHCIPYISVFRYSCFNVNELAILSYEKKIAFNTTQSFLLLCQTNNLALNLIIHYGFEWHHIKKSLKYSEFNDFINPYIYSKLKLISYKKMWGLKVLNSRGLLNPWLLFVNHQRYI